MERWAQNNPRLAHKDKAPHFVLVNLCFQPARLPRQSQEILETQRPTLFEDSMWDPECLGKKVKHLSPVRSLNKDKAEEEPRRAGLPGTPHPQGPRLPGSRMPAPPPPPKGSSQVRTMQRQSWQRTLAGLHSAFNTLVSPFNNSVCQELSAPTHPGPGTAGLFSSSPGQQWRHQHNHEPQPRLLLGRARGPAGLTSPAPATGLHFTSQRLLLWVKDRSSLLPSSPQRRHLPGQRGLPQSSLEPWARRGVLRGSNLVSSAIPIETQYLEGETKGILAMTLVVPGDFSSNSSMFLRQMLRV